MSCVKYKPTEQLTQEAWLGHFFTQVYNDSCLQRHCIMVCSGNVFDTSCQSCLQSMHCDDLTRCTNALQSHAKTTLVNEQDLPVDIVRREVGNQVSSTSMNLQLIWVCLVVILGAAIYVSMVYYLGYRQAKKVWHRNYPSSSDMSSTSEHPPK